VVRNSSHPNTPRVGRKISLEMICPYEPGKPIEEVKRELGLDRVIKLASNENPLGPSRRAIDTLNGSDLELHMYPDYDGWYLRRALGEQTRLPVEQIMLGAGSSELMRLVGDAFLAPGDEALLVDVTFPVYLNVVHIAGATPVVVPVDETLQYDLERLLEAVTPRTKLVFLSTPNNPTGLRIPPADLATFLERLPPRVLCVLDLAYWEYMAIGTRNDCDPIELLHRHENVLVLRTFSKVYGLAGLRVGFARGHAGVVGALCKVRIPFSTSTAAQLAARVALSDHDHVTRSVALNAASRTKLEEITASAVGCEFDLDMAGLPPDASSSPHLVNLFLFILFFPSLLFSTCHLFWSRPGGTFRWNRVFNTVLIVTVSATVIRLLSLERFIPGLVLNALKMVGAMTVPLLMIVIGGNIYIDFKNKGALLYREVSKFLLIKNMLFPAVALLLLVWLKPPYEIALIILIQSAVPPVTAIPIIVEREGGNRQVVNQFLFASALFSVLSIPLVMYLFGFVYPVN